MMHILKYPLFYMGKNFLSGYKTIFFSWKIMQFIKTYFEFSVCEIWKYVFDFDFLNFSGK